MDRGGRLLRSLGGIGARLAPTLSPAPSFAAAGPADPFAFPGALQAAPRLPRRRLSRRMAVRHGLERLVHARYLGSALVVALLAGAALFGAVKGGGYQDFIEVQGTIPDILAKTAGFDIKAVTITGTHELTDREILAIAGVRPRNSLLLLDVAALRQRLTAIPLIKEASVSKLYPNRLLIELEERQPFALWQKDGMVQLVAKDGTPIDDMHDARFERLPLVVGDGANANLAQYMSILEASGELRDRIRAGMYVSGRRWTLKTDSGIDIDLPEIDPAGAVAKLAEVEHDGHILERDIVSLDMRVPDRIVTRLTADAAAAREALLAKKSKKKGAST